MGSETPQNQILTMNAIRCIFSIFEEFMKMSKAFLRRSTNFWGIRGHFLRKRSLKHGSVIIPDNSLGHIKNKYATI